MDILPPFIFPQGGKVCTAPSPLGEGWEGGNFVIRMTLNCEELLVPPRHEVTEIHQDWNINYRATFLLILSAIALNSSGENLSFLFLKLISSILSIGIR